MANPIVLTFADWSGPDVEPGKDSGTKYTTTTLLENLSNANGFVTCSSTLNAYAARAGYGVKLGTSSKSGDFTLDLLLPDQFSKIVVKAASYNDSQGTLYINGAEFDLTNGGSDNKVLHDCTIYPSDVVSSLTIATSATATYPYRAYVKSITFYPKEIGGNAGTYEDPTEHSPASVQFANLTNSDFAIDENYELGTYPLGGYDGPSLSYIASNVGHFSVRGIHFSYKNSGNKDNFFRCTQDAFVANGSKSIMYFNCHMGDTIVMGVSCKGSAAPVFASTGATAMLDNPAVPGGSDYTRRELRFVATATEVQIQETDGGYRLYDVAIREYVAEQEMTIAELIALQTATPNTTDYFVTTGVVGTILNSTYGNYGLWSGEDSILVYGTLDANGATRNFESLGINTNDTITVKGKMKFYNDVLEFVNVSVLAVHPYNPNPVQLMDTVYFINTREYVEPYCYAWANDGALQNAGWPGEPMTLVGTMLGYDLYSYVAPHGMYDHLIFNDNGDNTTQTQDMVWPTKPYYYNGKFYLYEELFSSDPFVLSIADIIALQNTTPNTTDEFTTTGLVGEISNTLFGNYGIWSGSDSIFVYGTLDAEGNTRNFSSLGINTEDTITIKGKMAFYNGVLEFVDVTVLSHSPYVDYYDAPTAHTLSTTFDNIFPSEFNYDNKWSGTMYAAAPALSYSPSTRPAHFDVRGVEFFYFGHENKEAFVRASTEYLTINGRSTTMRVRCHVGDIIRLAVTAKGGTAPVFSATGATADVNNESVPAGTGNEISILTFVAMDEVVDIYESTGGYRLYNVSITELAADVEGVYLVRYEDGDGVPYTMDDLGEGFYGITYNSFEEYVVEYFYFVEQVGSEYVSYLGANNSLIERANPSYGCVSDDNYYCTTSFDAIGEYTLLYNANTHTFYVIYPDAYFLAGDLALMEQIWTFPEEKVWVPDGVVLDADSTRSLDLPAGEYEFKVTFNGSWNVNYGYYDLSAASTMSCLSVAGEYGDNIKLTLTESATVTIVVADGEITVTVSSVGTAIDQISADKDGKFIKDGAVVIRKSQSVFDTKGQLISK